MQPREAMELVLKEATQSPDQSTQNAAGLIIDNELKIIDHNRLPKGVAINRERTARPLKYQFIEHAERNAIYQAVREGQRLEGATMVAVWAACPDCARAIASAGICHLIRFPSPSKTTASHWQEMLTNGDILMSEAGVNIEELDPSEFAIPDILRDGKLWRPAP
jgi:dCMP deaminase